MYSIIEDLSYTLYMVIAMLLDGINVKLNIGTSNYVSFLTVLIAVFVGYVFKDMIVNILNRKD